jgi:type II secretory pathway component GspD/PulD (secretin)
MKGRLSLWVVLGVLGAVVVAWGCQGSKGDKDAGKVTAADPIADDLLGQVTKAPPKVAAKPKPVTVAKVEPPKAEPPKVTEPPKTEPPKVTEPPKTEPPKPAVPASRLDQLFSEMDKKEGVGDPQATARAEVLFAAGKKLFEDVRYEDALEKFDEALRVYPRHQAAAEYAAKTRSMMNMGLDPVRRALQDLETAQRLKAQEALLEIHNVTDAGNRSRAESRAARPGDENQPRDKVLSRQLSAAEKATEQYDRALEIIRWMPHQLDLGSLKRRIEAAKSETSERTKDLQKELADFQRERAQQESVASRDREIRQFRQTINAMLDRARFDYKNGKYEESEGICEQVLKLDPGNGDALSLRASSRDKKHRAREAKIYLDTRIEKASTMLSIEEASVPYSKAMVYPDNWLQIMRRDEATGTSEVEPDWMATIRRKLEKKVNFEFVQAPLSEAINFLQSVSEVNMVLDPAAKAGGERQITLRMNQATLSLALEWILKLAGLDYELRDNAVFISTPDNLKPDVKMLIYDVQDLTLQIPDFPGPETDLQANAAGALPVFAPPPAAPTTTTQSIVDMIKNRVRPESWLPGKGTDIQERQGKLVVVQRPEVHRMISSLLADLRQTQKIMVVVEGRLLKVREGLLEDIGVQWGTMDLTTPTIPTSTVGIGPHTRGRLTTTASIINNNLQVSPDRTPLGTYFTTASGNGEVPGLSAEMHFLEALQLRVMAHALRIKDNGTELQAPKLVVHNGQRAHMWIGTQQSYVSGASATGTATDPTVSQLLTGVVFDVRPIVSADRRYITMELRPSFTTLERMDESTSTTLSTTGGTGVGGVGVITANTVSVQLPVVQQVRVRTSATIPDGGIILIGGRMRDVQFNAEAGVPTAMDIPILGRLFRWNVKDNERENLAIMVTARSLLFEEEERKLF